MCEVSQSESKILPNVSVEGVPCLSLWGQVKVVVVVIHKVVREGQVVEGRGKLSSLTGGN